jgi:uncharacterized protein (TIGR00369 family)
VELAALLDITVLQRSDEEILAELPVTDGLKQPLGLVHGGVFAALADALTVTEGRAISNQTSFLRPITEGTIRAHARRRHHGRTTSVWEVDVTDDAGRLCALVRVTAGR